MDILFDIVDEKWSKCDNRNASGNRGKQRGAKAEDRKENGVGIGVDGEAVVSVKWGKLQNNETSW